LVAFPARKDFTDLELALRYAQEAGCGEVLVLGALGNRWDQTLANLLLPASRDFAGLAIRMVDGDQEISALKAGETLSVTGQPGDTVSLIPLVGDAAGITTSGLDYPLSYGKIGFGSTLGISNELTGGQATIRLRQGLLLVTIIHNHHQGGNNTNA
jgi:thiamine pyrophosphokinase